MNKPLLRRFFYIAGAMVSATSGEADAVTLNVTPATLYATFASAHAGDTLRLIGTFAGARLERRSFSRTLILDASRATFTDTLILKNDKNVMIYGGRFDVTKGSSYNRAAAVWGGKDITFERSTVIGTGDQLGIVFENANSSTVMNGRFDGLHTAIGFGRVKGGIIIGNRITHAVSDGIDIGSSHYVTASYNSCKLGMPGAGVHPDCIQLWSTAGQPVQSYNSVTHNVATGATQGFTSFSGGGGGVRLSFTYNSVNSSYPQGVACYDCINSDISFNSVSTLPDAAHLTNIHVIGGFHNKVFGNVIHPRTSGGRRDSANSTFTATTLRGPRNSTSDAYDAVDGVPEPASWAMLLSGFMAVGMANRRTRRSDITCSTDSHT